ncbi:MAG: DUF3024 domain-containing protein [Burkholderiaceae bacterium]
MKTDTVPVMPPASTVLPAALFGISRQPNELDLRRIVRRLETRVRYRYVAPLVHACERGYRIVSPCCSRNIDATGGIIDIAQIEFDEVTQQWNLYYRDHDKNNWLLFMCTAQLDRLMDSLNEDPLRVFWQ